VRGVTTWPQTTTPPPKTSLIALQASVSEPAVDPFGDRLPSGLKHHVVAHVGEELGFGAICAGRRLCLCLCYAGIKFSTQDQQWRGDAFGFGQVEHPQVESQSPPMLFAEGCGVADD